MPCVWLFKNSGMPVIFEFTSTSARFRKMAFGLNRVADIAMACYRLNALQRWLGGSPPEFILRDRVTQEPYQLITEPDELGYVFDLLTTPVPLVLEQFFRPFGPSREGAHWFYFEDLLAQMRAAADLVSAELWEDPPNGPGLEGWVHGARHPMGLDFIGNPQPASRTTTKFAHSGGWPESPFVNDRIASDLWNWKTDGAHPLGRPWYLDPSTKISPGNDQNTNLFEIMQFNHGTTPNSPLYPPDLQIMHEFYLETGYMPWRQSQKGFVKNYWRDGETILQDFIFDPRPGLNEQPGSLVVANSAIGAQFAGFPFDGRVLYRENWVKNKFGFDAGISGLPWKKKLRHWYELSFFGYQTESVRLVGAVVIQLRISCTTPSGPGNDYPALPSTQSATVKFFVNGMLVGQRTVSVLVEEGPFPSIVFSSSDGSLIVTGATAILNSPVDFDVDAALFLDATSLMFEIQVELGAGTGGVSSLTWKPNGLIATALMEDCNATLFSGNYDFVPVC